MRLKGEIECLNSKESELNKKNEKLNEEFIVLKNE